MRYDLISTAGNKIGSVALPPGRDGTWHEGSILRTSKKQYEKIACPRCGVGTKMTLSPWQHNFRTCPSCGEAVVVTYVADGWSVRRG